MSIRLPLPDLIGSEDQLDEVLTRPSPALLESIKRVSSPLLILGAGGKMGPTLSVLAKRAALAAGHPLQVIAVSRFLKTQSRTWLESREVETISCDLLEPGATEELPDSANILFLVGLKFGTSENPSATWAVNTLVPVHVAERFPRARIVALSTGNVYPLTDVAQGGSVEHDSLTPLGEYANAAVARERIFEYSSLRQNTPIAVLRLFYAVELRYGVLVDLARKIWNREAIDLANGYFNCIWQGDANELVLRAFSLASAPASAWNLCRPEVFSVRAVASRLGELLERSPLFTGVEAPTALLGNSKRLCAKLGTCEVALEPMLRWIVDWVKRGGRNLGKPTHFEVRDGKY